jgi:hypothetical protein
MRLLHKTLQRGPLSILPTGGGAAFKGVIREADPASWLGPLVDELHGAALRTQVESVEVDLRELEYANAAAWKCFVYWLKRMADDNARYRLHFLCEESHRWQQVGMSTLRVFGGERVQVTTYRGERQL